MRSRDSKEVAKKNEYSVKHGTNYRKKNRWRRGINWTRLNERENRDGKKILRPWKGGEEVGQEGHGRLDRKAAEKSEETSGRQESRDAQGLIRQWKHAWSGWERQRLITTRRQPEEMARVLLEFTHSSTDGTWNRASILHWSPSRYRYKDRAAVNPRNQISEKGNGKAPETDDIGAEVLKVEEYGDAYVAILKIFHDILTVFQEHAWRLEDWFAQDCEKGDLPVCYNRKGIALLNLTSKVNSDEIGMWSSQL